MIKRFNVFEEVRKEVVPFGNGSIVYTPKKWVGETVTVILERQPVNVRESIMKELHPFLPHVKGVFLFGSHARKEHEKDSDIDVMVVADKKFSLGKKGAIEFNVVEQETMEKELKGKDPFYFFNAIREAEPILNEELLEKLKKTSINKKNFKWLLEEAESALRVAEEFIKLDKLQGKKTLDSTAAVHTIVLRLKRIFLVQCILKNSKYSNKEFTLFMQNKGLTKEAVKKIIKVYRQERDGKKTGKILSVQETEKLHEIAVKELNRMRK